MRESQAPGSFILSMPRSGSTLLRLLLDTHAEIYAPDEILLGRLSYSLFSTLEGLFDEGDAVTQHDFDHSTQALAETRRILGDLMTTHTRRHGKKIWCEKTPLNLDYLRPIGRIFSGARFLLLRRHCLDNVMSCLKAGSLGYVTGVISDYIPANPRDFVFAMVTAWVEQEDKLVRFEERYGPRCLGVLYEDVVADPAPQLRRIFTFLDVVDEAESVIEKVFAARHHQRPQAGDGNAVFSTGISRDRLGTGHEIPWRRIQALPAELLERMNRHLERLGYPPVLGEDWEVGATETPAAETQAAGDAGTPPVEMQTLFERRLPERLASRDVSRLRGASYRFVLTGDGGGEWLVDLESSPYRVTAGGTGGTCEIRIAVDELRDILRGARNPAQFYREGKVRVSGRIEVESLRALIALLAA